MEPIPLRREGGRPIDTPVQRQFDFLSEPHRKAHVLVVALFVVAAAGVRLHHITEPPFDFHPTRQFHTAVIARSLDLSSRADTPTPLRAVAEANLRHEPVLEPPLLEHVALASGRLFHGDYLSAVRILSCFAWMLGALPLFAMTRRWVRVPTAALVAAVYLVLPFGVIASRSAQVDPLMVSLSLLALWAIVRHDAEPSPRRLWGAIFATAAATFIKPPVALFFLAPAFLSLARDRLGGLRTLVRRPEVAAFLVVSPLPALLYVFYAIFWSGSLRGQTTLVLRLQWVRDPQFWRGWLGMMDVVIGVAVLAACLLGVVFAQGRLRALLAGLWAGYFVFSFVFTYHTFTHDYYHLPIVPIAALSLAPLFERVAWPAGLPRLVVAVTALPLLLRAAFLVDAAPDPAPRIAMLRAIGGQIGPTEHAVTLSEDYGLSLSYFGDVSSEAWPTRGDMRLAASLGRRVPTAAARLEEMIREDKVESFVVLDQNELVAQPDLARVLHTRPIRAEGEGYVIYDLRP